jgi:hypothetical protein
MSEDVPHCDDAMKALGDDLGLAGDTLGLGDPSSDLRRLYAELEADGAAWRAAMPPPPGVQRQIDALASAATPTTEHRMHERIHVMRSFKDSPSAPTRILVSDKRPAARPADARPRGRLVGTLLASAAMVAVVTLFAVMLHSFAGRTTSGTPPTGNPTIAGVSGSYPTTVHGRWVQLTQFDLRSAANSAGAPAVAPSDPRVVYEPSILSSYPDRQPAALRRTDDGGAHWQSLALPVPAADVNILDVFVSPLDAHRVYLQIDDPSVPDCPSVDSGNARVGGNVLASGSGFCGLEYTSADGGAHWAKVSLPVPGWLSGTGLNPPALLGQGQRLYSNTGCVSSLCTRLVVSDDGGATWRTGDDAIMARGQRVCDYGAARSGATVFAIASAAAGNIEECNWLDQSPHALWRSDDAGAHWTRVASLPTPNERGMAVIGQGSADPLIYVDMPRTIGSSTNKMGDQNPVATDAADDIRVSADGGKTWHAAPTAGAPSGAKPDFGPLAVLGDGSIIMPFSAQGVIDPSAMAFYAWKLGDTSWHEVAPAIDGGFAANLVVTSSSSGDILWLSASMANGINTPDGISTVLAFRP